MKTYQVEGTYGSYKTPSTIFVAEDPFEGRWYVAEGSVNINYTYDAIEDGVDIEELSDDDTITSSFPIRSEEDLENAINE